MRISRKLKAFLIEMLIIIGSCLCKLLRRKTSDKYLDENDC